MTRDIRNYDAWAAHSFLHSPQSDEKAVLDYLLKNSANPYGWEIPDLSARASFSALALLGDKEYARSGTRREAGGLVELYKKQVFQDYLSRQREVCRSLVESLPDLSSLPVGASTIRFGFTLTSPYISRDDTALHLLDNPVKKEWVFKVPYVASTQWKGGLRAAVRGQKEWDNDHPDLLRLFGEANDERPEQGKSGCIYFYPTFFDRLGLEVINPHDRQTGAGSQPILMECVPAGTTGHFTLLYAPLDCIGADPAVTRRQVAEDLALLAQGLEALFTLYGFGAKTSSGFGLAELTGGGRFAIHYPDTQLQSPKPQQPIYPEALREFLESYPPEYLDMKPKQLKNAGVPNLLRQQAKEIKELYLQYQDDLTQYERDLAEWEASTATPLAPITERTFARFSDLAGIARQFGGGV